MIRRCRGDHRRYYELCVLSELRDRLRAADVWVTAVDDTGRTSNDLSPTRRWRSWDKAARCRSRSTPTLIASSPLAALFSTNGWTAIDVKAKGGAKRLMSRSTRAC